MPELPEVEKLCREIGHHISSKRIASLTYFRDSIRELIPKEEISRIVKKAPITCVRRRGKYILICTSKGALGVHLGMSGQLLIEDGSTPKKPHTHAVFKIDSDQHPPKYLHFVDPRRFGRLFAVTANELKNMSHPFLKGLGREPLETPEHLAPYLFQKSRGSRKPLKSFLMDPAIVVGVGNIYANESLWRSQLSPFIKAQELTRQKIDNLSTHIVAILCEAIEFGGTTLKDYRSSDGKPGSFQGKLAVYGKEGKSCRKCRSLIKRDVQSGRSTFFCPTCQK